MRIQVMTQTKIELKYRSWKQNLLHHNVFSEREFLLNLQNYFPNPIIFVVYINPNQEIWLSYTLTI